MPVEATPVLSPALASGSPLSFQRIWHRGRSCPTVTGHAGFGRLARRYPACPIACAAAINRPPIIARLDCQTFLAASRTRRHGARCPLQQDSAKGHGADRTSAARKASAGQIAPVVTESKALIARKFRRVHRDILRNFFPAYPCLWCHNLRRFCAALAYRLRKCLRPLAMRSQVFERDR